MQKFNVSEEWRKNVPFKEYGQNKVVDIDKVAREIQEDRKKRKLSMFITIAAVRSDKFKEINNTIRFCTDPITGIMYGIAYGLLPDGNVKWRAIILNEINTLNLDMINDAQVYAVLRMHPKVQGSPFEVEDPLFKIVDLDEIAAQKNMFYLIQGKAMGIAQRMKKEEILYFGRYLGEYYSIDASPSVIRASLFEKASKNPIDFMEKYEHPSRKIYEVLKSAQITGVVSYEYDKGFRYKSIILGLMESECVSKLLDDQVLYDSIYQEVVKRDVSLKNLLKQTEKEVTVKLKKEDSEENQDPTTEIVATVTDPNEEY